jgi:hypothetical protein
MKEERDIFRFAEVSLLYLNAGTKAKRKLLPPTRRNKGANRCAPWTRYVIAPLRIPGSSPVGIVYIGKVVQRENEEEA